MQTFNELQLSPFLMRAISELGYEKPSPIQAETLPILLGAPTDFLGLAATGTGKTAAFGIPLLEKMNPALKKVQALIICPTRELALQVSGQINLLGKYKGIKALPVYGGSDYSDQIRGLKSGVSVVVGTPGRLVDHMERGTLRLDDLQMIVLDEADEMISMGFKEDLETILGSSPRESSNVWLFSATMSSEVRKVADEYLRSPQQVQVNRTEMVPKTIEQIYYMTHEGNKPEILCKLVDAADDFYGLVFCQTKALVTDLTQYLMTRRYQVDCLHGDKDQNARERTMQAFRDRKVTLLICTDVASRGLDVKDVTHVINYSLPRELDNYVHRIGRTARSGKTGFAMSLVTPSHRVLVGRIEKMTKSRMREGKVPTRREIGAKKIAKVLSNFEAQQTFIRAVELLDQPWKDALSKMTSEEVAGRLLSMMFPEVFAGNLDRENSNENPVKSIVKIKSEGSSHSPHAQRRDGRRDGQRGDFFSSGGRRDSRNRDGNRSAPSGGFGRQSERPRREEGARSGPKPVFKPKPPGARDLGSDWNRPLARS